MSERGPLTPLPARLDHAQREAARILVNGAARAYNFRRTDDRVEDACETCGGDGCGVCDWTGEKQ